MATTTADLNNTKLNNRTLWYDGDSTVPEAEVVKMVTAGLPVDGIFVEQLTADIKQYNRLVSKEHQITIKSAVRDLSFNWNIPPEYKNLDLVEYCNTLLETHTAELSGQEQELRVLRVSQELSLYFRLGLRDMLRTLIYIINTLRTNNIVWGVGRGSSVSSYVLYLIGVHDVDSVKYELDITDFLRIK